MIAISSPSNWQSLAFDRKYWLVLCVGKNNTRLPSPAVFVRSAKLDLMIGCLPTNFLPLQRKPKKAMTIEDERRLARQKFKIVQCEASVDQTPTKIRENNSTLNYVTPHFRADAEVEVAPLKEGEIYTVGWVQAVTDMKFYNTYPTGTSSWEIQELNSGESKAVSDADGRQYPWYGVTTERVTLKGPQNNTAVRVLMNDNFSPTVSWAIPVGRDQPDTLQSVQRDQSFIAWLVVKNEINGEIYTLKSYEWRAVINIAVDCSQCVGRRAKLLNPVYQEQPKEAFDLSVPNSALCAPRANEAQKFVWRTLDSELIFEVSCTPAFPPALQPTAIGEVRYPCRFNPYWQRYYSLYTHISSPNWCDGIQHRHCFGGILYIKYQFYDLSNIDWSGILIVVLSLFIRFLSP